MSEFFAENRNMVIMAGVAVVAVSTAAFLLRGSREEAEEEAPSQPEQTPTKPRAAPTPSSTPAPAQQGQEAAPSPVPATPATSTVAAPVNAPRKGDKPEEEDAAEAVVPSTPGVSDNATAAPDEGTAESTPAGPSGPTGRPCVVCESFSGNYDFEEMCSGCYKLINGTVEVSAASTSDASTSDPSTREFFAAEKSFQMQADRPDLGFTRLRLQPLEEGQSSANFEIIDFYNATDAEETPTATPVAYSDQLNEERWTGSYTLDGSAVLLKCEQWKHKRSAAASAKTVTMRASLSSGVLTITDVQGGSTEKNVFLDKCFHCQD